MTERRQDLATPTQLRFIQVLWSTVSRAVDDKGRELALNRFCNRIVKKDNIRFISKIDASKLIKVLETMQESQPCPA